MHCTDGIICFNHDIDSSQWGLLSSSVLSYQLAQHHNYHCIILSNIVFNINYAVHGEGLLYTLELWDAMQLQLARQQLRNNSVKTGQLGCRGDGTCTSKQ